MNRSGPPETIGLALDGTSVTAVWREGDAWRAATTACDATSGSLGAALSAVLSSAPAAERVFITLLRPLANMATPAFPQMRRNEVERVLSRDWERHSIGMRATPHTAAVRAMGRGQWRAVLAPTELLDALSRAASEFGWQHVTVQASDDAMAGAVSVLLPNYRAMGALCVIACGDEGPAHGTVLRNGEPVIGRRFLPNAGAMDIIAFAPADAPVIILGATARANTLARELGEQGVRATVQDPGKFVVPSGARGSGAALHTEAILAAAGTLGAPSLSLLSPAARAVHTRGMRTIAQWLWMATAAALLVAFLIEQRGVSSALNAVQRERADLSAQVRAALAARADVERQSEAATVLAEREAAATRSSGVIAAVAVAIPRGTSLTTLSVSGDSVVIEGESKGSAAVYDALRSLPELAQVRLGGTLRQERQAGDQAIERFAFTARLRTLASRAQDHTPLTGTAESRVKR